MPDGLNHTVKEGDCMLSIADQYGFFWESLWGLPENAALKAKRKHPTVLMPGDVVFVPELREKEEPKPAEATHKFKEKGIPGRLRLRLLSGGEPLAQQDFRLSVDGELFSGKTDADGHVLAVDGAKELKIKPGARQGKLKIGTDQGEYILDLGWMTPIDEVSGAQARLHNLGFTPGGIDNGWGDGTKLAMQKYQKARKDDGLKKTERLDDKTRDSLERAFGC